MPRRRPITFRISFGCDLRAFGSSSRRDDPPLRILFLGDCTSTFLFLSLSLACCDCCIIINTLRACWRWIRAHSEVARAYLDDTCPIDCIRNRDIGVLSLKVGDRVYMRQIYLSTFFLFCARDYVIFYDFFRNWTIYYRLVLYYA